MSVQGERSFKDRWISLAVLCTAMLMIVLDTTVVVVALPNMRHDFGLSRAALAWILNAYLIAFGGLLLLWGRVSDFIGVRRVFIIGIAIFTLASLACGLSPSLGVLVGARFVQGIGGAMASSVILAMIVTQFTDERERARAMSFFNFTASAGGAVGVLVGGVVTQFLGWHWIFLINVPIGIAAAILAGRFVHDTRADAVARFPDALGATVVTVALMSAVYAVVSIPDDGWMSRNVVSAAILSAVAFALFLARQCTAKDPLVPLHLFRSRTIVLTNAVEMLLVSGMFGFFFLEALALRGVRRLDTLHTGLAFLPVDVTVCLLSLGPAERIINRVGARNVMIAGNAMCGIALCMFALLPITGSFFLAIFVPMLLVGIAIGVAFPALLLLGMAGAAPEDAGVTSGLLNTTAQVGGAFGLAILASISSATTIGIAYGVGAVALFCATLLGFFITQSRSAA